MVNRIENNQKAIYNIEGMTKADFCHVLGRRADLHLM